MSQPTSIFSNCSKHYEIEILFEQCVNATTPCQSITQIETAITIAYVDYYSSVTLFTIAGLMNIYCLIIIIPLFCRMQNDSKKKYIFLITRCTSGLIAVIAWLLIQCIYIRFIAPTAENFPYYVLALALNIGSTYALLGSYVGMAGILYLGVLNPIAFNQFLSLKLVYTAVCIIFIISIILAIPISIFQAAIAIPMTSLKCTTKSCAPLITLINFILVFGSLIVAIFTLSFVLISLSRHRKTFKKIDAISNTSLNSAVRLLSWTLFAVILVLVAEIIPFVFMEVKRHEGTFSGCFFFYHASKTIVEVAFALIESSIWSIALIIDPLTNIIFDRTVSKQVKIQVNWIQKSCARLVRIMTRTVSKEKVEKEETVCHEQTTQTDSISSE